MLRVGVPRALVWAAARPSLALRPVFASAAFRFQSTTPTSSEISTTLPDFSAVNNAVEASLPLLHSDQIGYLESIGLADGWGPTSILEHVLEYTHVYTGLPWWGTIIASTFLVRTIMFPVYVKSSANMAKMLKVKPVLDKLMDEMRNGDTEERMVAMKQRSKLYKDHGIKTAHSLLPALQLPVAYGFFQAARRMANHPVEGFQNQGAFWFPDLSQVDPYCGLQVLTAFVVTGMIRSGGETGAQTMNPMFKKTMTWLPFLSILVTQNMSAAVVLYFAANSIFSLIQSLVLKNRHFRKWAKIPPIEKAVPVEGAKKPPATIGEWWTDFNTRMKEQSKSKMEKTNKQLEVAANRRDSRNAGFIKRH